MSPVEKIGQLHREPFVWPPNGRKSQSVGDRRQRNPPRIVTTPP